VAEAAVVGIADEMTGQALVAFVTLKQHEQPSPELASKLCEHVGEEIGKFAKPRRIRFADAVPKTRSGKIMRRLLRDLAAGKQAQGDMTTLEDISVLAKLRAEEDE
jgi:acetyl-CoA synthetase